MPFSLALGTAVLAVVGFGFLETVLEHWDPHGYRDQVFGEFAYVFYQAPYVLSYLVVLFRRQALRTLSLAFLFSNFSSAWAFVYILPDTLWSFEWPYHPLGDVSIPKYLLILVANVVMLIFFWRAQSAAGWSRDNGVRFMIGAMGTANSVALVAVYQDAVLWPLLDHWIRS
jgi:hypothetical protein